MKNNNKCPKCSGVNIVEVPGRSSNGNFNFVNVGMFGSVGVTRYLCSHCGYSEEWIDKKEDIEKVVKKFGK